MILLPAIDLFGGRVVRLTEGDFSRRTDYAVTALEMARRFKDAGCGCIHIVDLEGAKIGRPCHLGVLREIRSLGMFIQYGGGLRSLEAVADAVKAGADRVMIGSLLFKDRSMPQLIAERFGTAAMPAIDVRDGMVVHSGWQAGTGLAPLGVIQSLTSIGFSTFLVTDTERDGCMKGARTELYAPLTGGDYQIVAAGGITTAGDIRSLKAQGVAGAVIGKSLYEGGITLQEALAAVN